MTGIGIVEVLIVLVVGLIGLAIPIATLIGVFLTYGKVRRIEQTMSERG